MRKLRYVRKSCLTFLVLSAILFAALEVSFPFSTGIDGTIVHVEPSTSVANPYQLYGDNNFTISVNVTDVIDLFGFDIRLQFDNSVLELFGPVQEGEFLKRTDSTAVPPTSFSWSLIVNGTVARRSYIQAVGVINPDPFGFPVPWDPHGEDGSGTLFTVRFRVKAPGKSELKLYNTNLWDRNLDPISHSLVSGDFHTEVPVATFSYAPNSTISYGRPIVGENITFDASSSYDPDNPEGGGIASYMWDFNDTTPLVIEDDPITYHVYDNATSPLSPYEVKLTVTDDEGNTTTYSIEANERKVHVYYHDISLLEIIAPDEVHTREVATVNVTVLNNGSHPEYFNITTYYDSNPIETQSAGIGGVDVLYPGENETYSFDWNTYKVQTTLFSNQTFGDWDDPGNGFTNDTMYTSSNITQNSQVYLGYFKDTSTGEDHEWAGWAGVSKVEVGLEVHTDLGGDDNLTIQVAPIGSLYGDEHNFTITSTTDKVFWIDVTSEATNWDLGQFEGGLVKARITYFQVGGEATHIYVDWLQLRVTPSNPANIAVGTYALWSNALLVEAIAPHSFRPGQEENLADNTLFHSVQITEIPYRDISVKNVTVSPTDLAIGLGSTVKVTVENLGNVQETFNMTVTGYLGLQETFNTTETGLNLRAGASRTYTFVWLEAANTTIEGTYNITAYIPTYSLVIEGETYVENVTTNNAQSVEEQIRLLPVSFFTFSPDAPKIGDEVTFDASASYAPGDTGESIENYIWDLGDGTDMEGVAVLEHTYDGAGTFSVKLTVVDNEGLNSTKTTSVKVEKLSSNITLFTSPTTVPISLKTTISGAILVEDEAIQNNQNVTVFINFTSVDEDDWLALANVSTNENGEYLLDWSQLNHTWPQQNGTYTLKAFWLGDDVTLLAESSELNVTIIVRDAAITDVALSTIRLVTGDTLTITVTAANKGTTTETLNVTVYQNDTLIQARILMDVAAGDLRLLSFNWTTTEMEEGVYTIKAMAEPLLGETYLKDNSRTSGVFIQDLPVESLNIFLYTTVAMIIVVAVMAVFMIRMLRSKPK